MEPMSVLLKKRGSKFTRLTSSAAEEVKLMIKTFAEVLTEIITVRSEK